MGRGHLRPSLHAAGFLIAHGRQVVYVPGRTANRITGADGAGDAGFARTPRPLIT
jgi:hypothetical protein